MKLNFTYMRPWVPFIILAVIVSSCSGNNNREEAGHTTGGADNVADSADTMNAGPGKLNERVRENPNDPEAYARRADYFMASNKYELAKNDLEQAISIDSTNAQYHLMLGNVNWQVKYLKGAIRSFETAVNLDPGLLEGYLKLGEIYFYTENRPKSFQYLNEALRMDNLNEKIYFLKGMNYKEMGKVDDAISNFQTAVEINPDYYQAYMQLGLLFDIKKDYDMAASYYDNALRLNPESPEALYARGMANQSRDSIRAAIRDYQHLLNYYPGHRNASYNLGYLHYSMENYADAVRYFSTAIENDPGYIEAYIGRAVSFKALGKRTLALQDLEKVLALDPGNELARLELAELH